ncbi:MAG: SDR family NAD(P)-dependent oxidoreductase [Acidobacteriales bacterium]|nr:SDR family NAD(P)-dependent oxidoreductase [Terriglobales bacterium]
MHPVKRGAAMGAGALAFGGLAAALIARRASRPSRDFVGKTVVITGGSRGLGFELARQFGRRGARVAICARTGEQVERAREKLEGLGIECFAQTCDVSQQEQVNKFIADVRSRFGAIDVLVNNAGIIQVGPFANQTVADFEQAMNANFWAAVYATYAVLPEMRERGRGSIVNISSIGGKIPVPHLLPYTASKFALTGFSEGLHAELNGTGISVTTVCPGLMRTGSQINALFKGQHEKEYAWFMLGGSTPLSSINASRAARQIVEATKHRRRELIITWQAELVARLHGLLPELTGAVLAQVNRLLPEPGSNETRRGSESESAATRNPITIGNRWASRRLNEKRAV